MTPPTIRDKSYSVRGVVRDVKVMETARPLWSMNTPDSPEDRYTSFFNEYSSSSRPQLTNLGVCGCISYPNEMDVRRIALYLFDPPQLKLSEYQFDFRIGETFTVQLCLGSMQLAEEELPGGEKRTALSYDFGGVQHRILSVQNFGIWVRPRLPYGVKAMALLHGSYWQEVG